jgi:hypothetical protein
MYFAGSELRRISIPRTTVNSGEAGSSAARFIVDSSPRVKYGPEFWRGIGLNKMKYYIYISNSKLDMMFPQVPKQLADQVATELGVNTGLLKASVKPREVTETSISKLQVVTQYLLSSGAVGDVRSPRAYFKGTLPMKTTLISNPEDEDIGDYAAITFSSYGKSAAQKEGYGAVVLVGSYHNTIGMQDAPRKRSVSGTAEIITQLENAAQRQEKRVAEWERQIAEWDQSERRRSDSWLYRVTTDEKPDPRNYDPRHSLDLDRGVLSSMSSGKSHWEIIHDWPLRHASGPEQNLEFLAKTLYVDEERVLLGTPIYVAESQPEAASTKEGSGRSWWARMFGQ